MEASVMTPDMEVGKSQPLCEICKITERKYKCPRCEMSTCSLECCRQHKTQFQCSGQRERIKFIPSSEFTEKHLRQDFHFLEDVLQTRVGAKRNYANLYDESAKTKFTNPTAVNSMAAKQSLLGYPKNVKLLVNEAAKRSTKVLVQPLGMSRRKENTSNFSAKKQIVFWRISLVFVVADDFKMSDILHVTSQTMDQLQAMKAPAICLHINSCSEIETIECIRQKVLASIQSGSILKQVMRPVVASQNTLRCLLRIIPSPADNPLFREVDQVSSVRDSLSGMTVIEYPTLYFCHTAALDKFRLLLHDPQQSATENTSDSMMVDVVTGHEVREEKQAAVRQSEQVTFSSDTHALSLLGDDTEVNLNGPNSLETSDAMNVSPLKKRTYGGLLNLDYASSSDDEDDMEEEREAEVEGCSTGVGADMSAFLPPPLPVGNAASKYGDFFKQLSALQQVAHGSVKKDSGDCEIEEGEVEEEESSEQGEDESASSSSAISEDDDSSSESDSGGSSEDKDD